MNFPSVCLQQAKAFVATQSIPRRGVFGSPFIFELRHYRRLRRVDFQIA